MIVSKRILQLLVDGVISVGLTLLIKLGFDLKKGTLLTEFCVKFAEEHSFPYSFISGFFIWVIVFLIYQCLFKKRFYYRKVIKMLEKEKTNINTDDPTGVKVFSFFRDCLNKTIDSIVQGAGYQLIHSDDTNAVDLAYEFSILNGTVDGDGNYSVDKGTVYQIRRNRVLGFNSKFIHRWNVLYATEFNLPKFIGDPSKWHDDEVYRKQLENKGNRKQKCQRFVFLTKSDIEAIMDDHDSLTRLNNYLAWHITKGWHIFMYITESEITTLRQLGFGAGTPFESFVDLLIVLPRSSFGRKIGLTGRVLLQDQQQRYKVISDKALVESYKSWFEAIPKQDYDSEAFPVIINFSNGLGDYQLKMVMNRSESLTPDDLVQYKSDKKEVRNLKSLIKEKIDSVKDRNLSSEVVLPGNSPAK